MNLAGPVVQTALVGASVSALLFCISQAREEYRVSRALTLFQENGHSSRNAPAANLSPREALYQGAALARRAGRLPDGPGRTGVLEDAARLVDSAVDRRPRWGEAWVNATFVNMLRFGLEDPRTVRALHVSYRVTPFLRDQASWRIEYAIAAWPWLPKEDRQAAAYEAILLARASRNLATHVRILTIGTPLQPMISGRVWAQEQIE